MTTVSIGTLKIAFRLHGIVSLKEKRGIANSLKQKLRNKFNVAVAETGVQDSLHSLELSVVTVSGDVQHIQSIVRKGLAMIETVSDDEIVDVSTEVFGV